MNDSRTLLFHMAVNTINEILTLFNVERGLQFQE